MSEKQNKTPESRLRATQKWQTANYKNVRLVFHKTTEADMIEWIEKQPNKLQYIKDLIRADMGKESK